jgi:hypothetical protein
MPIHACFEYANGMMVLETVVDWNDPLSRTLRRPALSPGRNLAF